MSDRRDSDFALSEFWNDVTAGRAGDPDGVDPVTAAAVRRLHTLASQPLSDSARERVWRGLMASTDQTTSDKERPMDLSVNSARYGPLAGPNGQFAPPRLLPPVSVPRGVSRRTLVPAAFALALLALVAGWWFFGTPWAGEDHAAIPAPQITPNATVAPAASPAASVPTFRGDFARTGVEPGPGPAGKPVVRWQVDVPYAFWGAPSVVDGTVYASGNGGAFLALDAATGRERWRYDAPSFSHASPTVVDGVVYAGFNDGYVRAFDATTGALKWELDAGATISDTPAVVDGAVYIGTGSYGSPGNLVAADAATGQERWRLPLDSSGFASPAVVNGVVYVGTGDTNTKGTVYAVDAATGKQLWTFATGYDFGGVAIVNGSLYVASQNGVFALDAATGAQRWTFAPAGDGFYSAPAVADGTVYAASQPGGFLVALDAASGTERWRADLGPSDNSNSSPVVATGTVYVGSDGGWLHAVDAASGSERWRFQLPGDLWSTPTVANGVVYIGTGGWVGNGAIYALGDPLSATAAVATPAASPLAQTCGANAATTSAPAASPVPVALSVATPTADLAPVVTFRWAIDGSVASATKVGNVAIDRQCRLWVTDISNNRFLIYDLDGNFLESWGTAGNGDGQFNFGGNGYYGGVSFAPDGGFYVVDVGNRRVQQFAADRSFVRAWSMPVDGSLVVGPYWLAVGPDGNVYVSTNAQSNLIEVFSSDGKLIRRFGSRFPGDDALGPIAFDPAGNTWVQVPGEPSIEEFSPTGEQIGKIDLTGSMIPYVFGLAIDAAGRFYVVDGSSSKVAVFDPKGNFLFSWGEYGRNPGQLNNPWWIALDGSGGVYVAQQNQSRVQRFQLPP